MAGTVENSQLRMRQEPLGFLAKLNGVNGVSGPPEPGLRSKSFPLFSGSGLEWWSGAGGDSIFSRGLGPGRFSDWLGRWPWCPITDGDRRAGRLPGGDGD